MTTQQDTIPNIAELEERIAAILADGITVGSTVHTAPNSAFFADLTPFVVTEVTDPTVRPGLFPGERGQLNGGTVRAHPVGDPTKEVLLARSAFVVLPPMTAPTFVVRRKVGRKVEVVGHDVQGANRPEWMTDERHAVCSTTYERAKWIAKQYDDGTGTVTIDRNV